MTRRRSQSGNIFFTLFGAVGLVGIVGASSMTILKGPVTSMHNVTQRTIAENAMIAAGKLTIMAASQPGGDCDGDKTVEPPGYVPAGTAPHPSGGGLLPASVGAAKQDPWGNEFGYCVWDHGTAIKDGSCPDNANRLAGVEDGAGLVVAIISSGPDRLFQTSCHDAGSGDFLNKPSGSDDIVLSFTYAEAQSTAGGAGLWLPVGDDGAEIQRSLEVKADDGSGPVFAVDNTAGGPSMKVDFIQQLSAGVVEFLSGIKGTNIDISGDLDVTGAATLGSTDVAGDLSVTGAGTLGSASLSGSLTVDGATTLEGLAAGTADVGSLTASGLANLNSLGVTTNAVIGGSLTASGHAALGSLDLAGDIQMSGNGNLITTTADELVLEQTGDVLGATRLRLQNRNGLNGAVFENATLDLVDFAFKGHATSSTMNLRAEYRDAFTLAGNEQYGEMQIFAMEWPAGHLISRFGQGRSAIMTTRLGIGTESPSSRLHVAGSAEINGQLDMAGNSIVNVAAPINTNDAVNKGYVDQQVAAGTGFEEQDPTIIDISDGKWCVGLGDGITCTAEPPIGDGDTLAGLECAEGEIPKQSGGLWSCSPDTGSDNLGDHTATQDLDMAGFGIDRSGFVKFEGTSAPAPISPATDTLTQLGCTADQIPKFDGTVWSCADGDGNDNLGNHTATQDLDMAGFGIEGSGFVKFEGTAAPAPVAPDAGEDTLSKLSCSTGQIAKFNGTAWACSADTGSDNLGDHTATQNIAIGTHWVSGDGGSEGISIDAAGTVTASGKIRFTPIGGLAPPTMP